jgi:hypothetical protein
MMSLRRKMTRVKPVFIIRHTRDVAALVTVEDRMTTMTMELDAANLVGFGLVLKVTKQWKLFKRCTAPEVEEREPEQSSHTTL